MRVQATGSATWLMLFVLGVTAVVGVFGLPQFAPVIASSDNASDDRLSGSIASYRQAGTGESMAQGVEDLFAPIETIGETETSSEGDSFLPLDVDRLEDRAASDPRIADLFGKPSEQPQDEPNGIAFKSRSVATVEVDNRQPFRRVIPADDNGVSRVETSTAAEREPLTWRAAVSRLNSLGIRHYQLSAGTQPNEFHFSCFFTSADNPRVTHRFESEASEPLQAVRQVLTQIDQWQNGR